MEHSPLRQYEVRADINEQSPAEDCKSVKENQCVKETVQESTIDGVEDRSAAAVSNPTSVDEKAQTSWWKATVQESALDRVEDGSLAAASNPTSCWAQLEGLSQKYEHQIPILAIAVVLRGFGQVVFCESSFTGFVYLVALFVSDPWLGLLGLLGCVGGSFTAFLSGFDADFVGKGLAGYNGVLVGCCFAVFLSSDGQLSWQTVVATLLGSIVQAFVTLSIGSMSNMPAWTLPFNFVALAVLLNSQPLGQVSTEQMHSALWSDLAVSDVLASVLRGTSQIFLADHWASGMLVVLGTAWHSPVMACSLVLASGFGVAVAFLMEAPPAPAVAGLWGFNPALTAAAVYHVFEMNLQSATLIAWSSVATAVLASGMTAALSRAFLVPPCTLPFCIVATLVFQLDGKVKGYRKRGLKGWSFVEALAACTQRQSPGETTVV